MHREQARSYDVVFSGLPIMPSSPPHGHALRKGRCTETGRAYLLTIVIENRRPLFLDWRVGRLLVTQMRAEAASGRIESMAWVIMPDHLHWLVTLRQGNLAELMRRVKSRSAIAINASLGGSGQIWQKGYHDHALRADEDLPALARYVVANPLRAGLVASVREYPLWDAMWL